MKLTILGIHNLKQTVVVSSLKKEGTNSIEHFETSFNRTLCDVSSHLQMGGHDVSLIANFSSAPKSIMVLNELEENGVSVYPDLQTEVTYDLEIQSPEGNYQLLDPFKLTLSNYQINVLEQSHYILTNQDSFEFLHRLNEIHPNNIIVMDHIPMYRALEYVEGIVLSKVPENKEETVKSLIQSGLFWIAIDTGYGFEFHTLKHSYKINITDYHKFLDQFLKAVETKALVDWLEANKQD